MRGPPVIVQLLSVMPRRRRRRHPERGAAAVEMALVLPVLLFLLMGMIDFGRAYSAQIQLSAAAREGVRLAALNPVTTSLADQQGQTSFGDGPIATRVTSAAGGLAAFTTSGCSSPVPTDTMSYACVTYCPLATATPTANPTATVVLRAKFTWISGISGMSRFFGGSFSGPEILTSTGVMRCTG